MQYIASRLRDRAATMDGNDRHMLLEAAVVIEGRDRSLANFRAKDEIADADRRAGEAERRLEQCEHENRMNRIVRDDMKRAAGFHPNPSFDEVWAACLAAYLATTP